MSATTEWVPRPAFSRIREALEQAGCRVEGHGRQLRAQCPHHEDSRPSLGLTDGMDKTLLTCRAGCDSADVLADLGLTWADLFDAPRERPAGDTWSPWRDRCACTPIAFYAYVSETGELLYQHVRGAHKEFAFRRPDPSSRSGWRWSLAGTRRVLYRLPEVLAAGPADVIWVTEGESDADALAAAGEIATTTDSGALTGTGAKRWRPEWSECLRGREVLVVADRDEPGHVHARHVAASLDGIAAFCWIVEAAKGKDARDHLEAGLGVTDFRWWSQ